jgi:hypothetical protein
MTTVHTKTQHGSDIYRVLGLHRRHGSVHEFSTGFRVRDKESKTQRSMMEVSGSGGGWKNGSWRNEQPSREGFLHCAWVENADAEEKWFRCPQIPANSGGG